MKRNKRAAGTLDDVNREREKRRCKKEREETREIVRDEKREARMSV